MILPIEIREIIDEIRKNNEEAYVVGGAVRNFLLNIEINDYDIATSGKPDKILKIFEDFRTVDIGKEFGTILVLYKGYEVEITTFRKDGKYKDGRRPESVEFSKRIEDDLIRRDFTINAMAYDGEKIIDLFGGQIDLEKKLIKTVENPYERFSEDYLRILRAIRFAAQLDFRIEENTFQACLEYGDKLSLVSKERIRDELFKILLSKKPSIGFEYMRKLNVLDKIIPEINDMVGFNQKSKYHNSDLYYHTLQVLDNTDSDLELRLAALFHDVGKLYTQTIDEEGEAHYYSHDKVGKEKTIRILKGLNTPNTLIEVVGNLVGSHMINNAEFKEKGIKRLINKLGKEKIYKLLDLQKADRKAMKVEIPDISDIIDMEEKINIVLEKATVYNEKQLAIDGNDVIELGYEKGRIIGEILSYALDLVLEDELLNEKNILLGLIEEEYRVRREH